MEMPAPLWERPPWMRVIEVVDECVPVPPDVCTVEATGPESVVVTLGAVSIVVDADRAILDGGASVRLDEAGLQVLREWLRETLG